MQDGYNSFILQTGKQKQTVFIDEFHYYKNITSVFKAVYDLNPQIKIYATGSSSLEIHKHLKESLAGRKFETNLYSFSFSEWLVTKNTGIPDIKTGFKILIHEKLMEYLKEFLKYGAMPGIIHFSSDIEKREYIESIYTTYITKDIKSFIKEEKIIDFNRLIEMIILLNGQLLNEHSLSQDSKLNIRIVKKYIDILKETFVIFLLPSFFTNKRKELVKTFKIYFYDPGIANMMLKNFSDIDLKPDKGAVIEQFVFLELQKSLDIRYKLNYWRTADKHEVDFILSKDNKLLPVEVKTNWNKKTIPNGMKRFFKYYPNIKKAVILHTGERKQFKYEGKTIIVLPLYYSAQVKALI